MLKDSLVGSTTIFVDNLVNNGLALSPVANSPLHSLAYACMSPMRDAGVNIDNITTENCCHAVIGYSNTFNSKIQVSSDHDVEMDKAINLAAKVIQSNITITRTVIQPLVRETVEYVEEALSKYSEVSFQTPIVTDRVFDAFLHPYVEDLVNEYGNVTYSTFPFINYFPTLTTQAIRELIPEMNSDMDSKVEEIITSIGANNLIELYESAFVQGTFDFVKASRNEHLILFLITNGLLTIGHAALEDKLSKAKDDLMKFRAQSALRIKNSIQEWRLAYENNRLIISYPERITSTSYATKDPIVVHEDLYNEWLAAGGDADLIYGAFFSDRALSGDKLLAEKAYYKREAEKYLQDLHSANESRRTNVIRRSIRESLMLHLDEDSRSEESRFNATHRDKIHERLNDATILELNDFLGFITVLVCDTLFPDTYAKKIIDGINYYQTLHPNTEVEDLVTLTISDMLVEWVVNLMYIKPIGAN